MAIYHLKAKPITRSEGHQAVKAAAYRSGEKLHDERADKTFDYSHRHGVLYDEIVAPEQAPDWMKHGGRERLWNEVEKGDKRKDAQLAKEYEVALPRELTLEQNRKLVHSWIQDSFGKRGLVADYAIHESGDVEGEKNPHAHIMVATRLVNEDGFGQKWRDIDKKDTLRDLRSSWADATNAALADAGHESRIDHRTLEAQGIDREPGVHLGKDATALEKQGQKTRLGTRNRQVEFGNRMRPYVRAVEESQEGWAFQTPASGDDWNSKYAEWRLRRGAAHAERDATQRSQGAPPPTHSRVDRAVESAQEAAIHTWRQKEAERKTERKDRALEPG